MTFRDLVYEVMEEEQEKLDEYFTEDLDDYDIDDDEKTPLR